MWKRIFARAFAPAAPPRLGEEDWAAAYSRLPFDVPDADLAPFRTQVERFLQERSFSGAHGLEVTQAMRLAVACQACLPIVHLPFAALGHWHEVILYPGAFRVRRHEQARDDGVVTEWDDELSGEAWDRGPIVLSWADVEQDLVDPQEGFNVVVHEIAHKLDLADGGSDGTPLLRDVAARRRWRAVMQPAFDRLVAQVDAGADTALDAYAAEAEDEFFAVMCEYWFTAPEVLRAEEPEVHALLRDYFAGNL
jgi:MtfA peptidase